MIRSVLISGPLDHARMYRALGEILEIGTAMPDERPVIVFESGGGDVRALLRFLECVFHDERTRLLLETTEVKIYEAHSAAALLAFSIGTRHEMAAGTCVDFHLPLLTMNILDVDPDDRRITENLLKECRDYETLLAKLVRPNGLSESDLRTELYRS
jgi:hypothetical protein